MDHVKNVGEFMAPVLATGIFKGVILGDATEELTDAIGEGGPVELFRPLMSLNRP